jgi:hypothetical protein
MGECGMISVCFESIAAIWMFSKKKLITQSNEEELLTAQENLLASKKKMEEKESILEKELLRLSKEAVRRKKAGDIHAARIKTAEKISIQKRLDRLRNGLTFLNNNIEAMKNSELDKEILQTLKSSSIALKNAGIGKQMHEIENLITGLDEHMRDIQDVTNVMATPISYSRDDEDELDAELNHLLEEEECLLLPSQSNKMKIEPIQEEPALITVNDLDESETQEIQTTTESARLAAAVH